MADQVFIYGLFDASGTLRYVGKAKNLQKRLASHMRDSRTRKTPVYDWIRKHGEPEIRVLEVVSGDWIEAEKRQISNALASGAKLLNLAPGGNQPFSTPAQRKKNGFRLNARLKSDPILERVRKLKLRMSISLREGNVTESTKAILRACAKKAPHYFGSWAKL